MLTKPRTLASLFRQLGFRWSAFRLAYAFRLRTGLIRLQMPSYKWKDRPLETWLKKNIPSDPEPYANWRKKNSPAFFFRGANQLPDNVPWNPRFAVNEAERILSGGLKYFAHEFHETGFPPNWHKDPFSGVEIPADKHWSQYSDDGVLDIKFIWEASRFGMIYTLVRAYASSRDERYAEAFWKLILDWAESNPPNTGPNWMDGQEAALRLMAWTFGLYAFLDSPSTQPQHIAQLTTFVAAQAQRVYGNTDFAIYTRGNHAVSEAFGLWMTGLLFPELKDSEKYLSFGREALEREAVKQIFDDGSYSMYSLNYHRFVLQIYFYAMKLGELNDSPFSDSIKRAVARSMDYLYQLIDPQTGHMPVHGSNDGALVLPLNSCDFADYRPVLQLGSFLTKGKKLFEPGPWDEDLYWLCGSKSLMAKVDVAEQTSRSFSYGGVYVLKSLHSKAIIRCTDFKERPSHADQLHVDLWWRGNNIACDAGTYLYGGAGIWRNGLSHTAAHNTVIVDSEDQMKMVSRFIWTDWAQGKVLQQGEKLWQGEHNGYGNLSDPVTHKRTALLLDNDRWLVLDHLHGGQPHHYALHWLLGDYPFTRKDNMVCLWPESNKYQIQMGLTRGDSVFSVVRADPNSTRGWRSRYYGHKEPAISVMLEADQPYVTFWTFFGSENDVVEVEREFLKVNSQRIPLVE